MEASGENDIFPNRMTDGMRPLPKTGLSDAVENWCERLVSVVAFLTFIERPGDYVICNWKLEDGVSYDNFKYLIRLARNTGVRSPRKGLRRNSWSAIYNRLCKPIARSETFPRLGFRWENIFIVNEYFTTGIRTTSSDEVDLIQMASNPLLYYEVEHPDDFPPSTAPGSFHPSLEKYFRGYVLFPGNVFVVPERTIYCLVSIDKCTFALDRCSSRFAELLKEDVNILPPKSVGVEHFLDASFR